MNPNKKLFKDIKRILDRNNLISYPYFNKWFLIHTYASNLKLGAVISQKVKLIAFYSIKLT